METKIISFNDDLINRMKDAGVRFIDLNDTENNRIVARNVKAVDFDKKVAEIKKRLKHLPDGIYILQASYSPGGKTKKDLYYIGKGNHGSLSENPAPVVIQQTTKREKTETENVLSYAEALKKAEQVAELKAENATLKAQLLDAQKKISELHEEIAELESEEVGAGNFLSEGLPKLLEPFAPMLPAFMDEYYKLQNRKLNIKEAEVYGNLAEKGLIQGKGGPMMQAFQNGKQQRRVQQQQQIERPDPNDAEAVENYCQYLDALNDAEFNQELSFIAQNAPELYAVIDSIYSEEEEEPQQ